MRGQEPLQALEGAMREGRVQLYEQIAPSEDLDEAW